MQTQAFQILTSPEIEGENCLAFNSDLLFTIYIFFEEFNF